MFEHSLVESTGRIRTRSRRYAVPSFLLEAALVTTLILLPYFYPSVLPRTSLTTPLIAPLPPPPAAVPAQPQHAAPTVPTEFLGPSLIAPRRIPATITPLVDTAPPGLNMTDTGRSRTGVLGLPNLGASPLPPIVPDRTAPTGRARVSSGVAAGQLIVPIRPVYPIIALQARVQGTVVVDAVIGKDGRIASLRALSGSPLLIPSALEAIRHARYRPWTLNGQPVEVETTIHIVFSLGDTHYTSRTASPVAPLTC
jgi:periplasmic protein TonB